MASSFKPEGNEVGIRLKYPWVHPVKCSYCQVIMRWQAGGAGIGVCMGCFHKKLDEIAADYVKRKSETQPTENEWGEISP